MSDHILVKPLEWRAMWAETPFGCYKIDKIESTPLNLGGHAQKPEVSYRPYFNGTGWGYIYGSVDMAKEACQKDFSKRILSTICAPITKEATNGPE